MENGILQFISGNCLFTDVFFSFWLREGTRDVLLSLLFLVGMYTDIFGFRKGAKG